MRSFDTLLSSFVEERQVPGAALAVSRNGRLIYARGCGYADLDTKAPVQPDSLFRIASISKPLTAVAVLQLVEQGKIRLEDCVLDVLKDKFPLPEGREQDSRWSQVTLLHLLQHTAGWDRDKSFDPMFRSLEIATRLGVAPPAEPEHIIRYMRGQPLDFTPGERYAYSNFGYCLLGRVIEKVSGQPYGDYVREHVLAPVGARSTLLGRSDASARADGEVKYYDEKELSGKAVIAPQLGKTVPLPYGTWYHEALDAHGGWISSAIDLVRFASAFDDTSSSKLLNPRSRATMFARPAAAAGFEKDGSPKDAYYGCGWMVRPVGSNGQFNAWHTGSLPGTSTLLVRRWDGLDWAILFNSRDDRNGKRLAAEIDPLLHEAAAAVKEWPEIDLFKTFEDAPRR